ncbi:hypothetical protein GOODEAATRI_032309 [Goodea atripinnis]|uniref:Uncharacterized protein n=1 Tax=Goodea atripinnis TaxID=208336 RepID=A0ABV0Q2U8_9TELE
MILLLPESLFLPFTDLIPLVTMSLIPCPSSSCFAQMSFLELLAADPAVSPPSSTVSSPTTKKSAAGNRTIAHLPVHPSTPLTLLKRSHSKDHTKRDSVLRTSMPLLLPNSASEGELTYSNKPLPTIYSKLTSLLSCTTYITFIQTNNSISPLLLSGFPDPSSRSSQRSVSTLLCFNKPGKLLLCLRDCCPYSVV